MNWFTVKLKYTKQLEDGTYKKVSEPYLLAADSFTDAEARIYEELGDLIAGEFNVSSIARTDFHDIFAFEGSDYWWKCKILLETADIDSEKSKKVTQTFLVSADSAKQAFEHLGESLSTLMVDFEITSIMATPILDVFPPVQNLDREISRRPIEEVEEIDTKPGKGVMYSASGTDLDDEIEDEVESEIEDEYSTEE
ncbi:MAG: DUF4494 domain-containing protein [Crocinitomicaceae bacterium]|nr:DUF4494 domain-containing protein [Crocinitomicaceae bacterium]